MSVLDDLASRLASEGVGTVGTDVWKGGLPDGDDITADPIIAVVETPGAAPLAVMGTAADPVRQPRCQLVGRGSGYAATRSLVQSAVDAVEMLDVTINGNRYLAVEALQEPFTLGTDDDGFHRIAVNVQVTRER